MKIFIAINKRGAGHIFLEKPTYNEEGDYWESVGYVRFLLSTSSVKAMDIEFGTCVEFNSGEVTERVKSEIEIKLENVLSRLEELEKKP